MRCTWRALCLLVALSIGACTESEPARDHAPPLEADFAARFEQPKTGPTSCPVTAVHFTDESRGKPTEWRWTFGDGTTSSEQHPTWEPVAGSWEITLQVFRGDDEDSITEMLSVTLC